MNEEEKREYEELKRLLYKEQLSQYGKRKLIGIIETQKAEIEKKDKIINMLKDELGYTRKLVEGEKK